MCFFKTPVPGGVAHFVELVNAADAIVGQDQSAGLQHQLTGIRILSKSTAFVTCDLAFLVMGT
jgi:hypothetical protein